MTLQEAYDQLAASGGGILPLGNKIYELKEPLRIHANNVRIIGQSKDTSQILAKACNAIEVVGHGAKLYLDSLSVITRHPHPQRGIGVYVLPGRTASLHIMNCRFDNVLNSIHYRNHPHAIPLGSIFIRNSHFIKASTHRDRAYYHKNMVHKVLLWGSKPFNHQFDVSYNHFVKNQYQRDGAIELCIWGDPANGIGKGPMTLNGGTVLGNTFKGATRECLAVSDHHKFVVAFNDIEDSNRVGLYVIRGYRSDILNNVVKRSRYRGHRLANLRECLWSWNEAYDSGREDNAKVGVGGMHISYSHNNVVTNNIIRASKGYAIAVVNGSSKNYIANNTILGPVSEVFVAKECSQDNRHDFKDFRMA